MIDKYSTILVEQKNHIMVITLNRPERLNALTPLMSEEINRIFTEADEDPGVRAIVLTGAGKGFCSGGDMNEVLLAGRAMDAGQLERMQSGFLTMAQRIMNVGKPVIAAVNGVAAGAGFCFVLFSDLRVASESAKFGITFVHRGLPATDMGSTWLLPRLVGLSKATEMLLLGEMAEARELKNLGLLHRVVPAEQVMSEALGLAGRLTELPPLALKRTKQALSRSFQSDYASHAAYETLLQTVSYSTSDLDEGIRSFQEKRAAKFEGK